jgi:hypothetical protein
MFGGPSHPTMTRTAALLFATLAFVMAACTGSADQPPPTASASGAPATDESSASQAPSRAAAAFAPAGPLTAGERYDLTLDLAPGTFAVPTSKWGGNGRFLLWVHAGEYYERAHMFFWTDTDPAGVFADPCAGEASPPVGATAADLAAAIAGLPGTELLSGPSDVTVDGRSAKVVEILVPEDIPCSPETFLLWYSLGCETEAECARWASWEDSIIRVWIIELDDGARGVVEAERFAADDPAIDQEFEEIVSSIDFE